jgi:16S rRNA (cytosine1402-N4)-methyltransferase
VSGRHDPVLCSEAVDALVLGGAGIQDRTGIYVDATFGRGGHSRKILCALGPSDRLIVVDRDLDAVAAATELANTDDRVQVCHGSFGKLRDWLASLGVGQVDGILMDLGVSSPQLDDPDRGFSFSGGGPLDMRMDLTAQQTAADWLNTESEAEIATVLRDYGEERFSRRIAAAIVEARPLSTTDDLVTAVRAGQPRRTPGKHDATRTFQAVRIKINDEIGELELGLRAAFDSLVTGGRLVVISFHSLEDRIVKRFFRSLTRAAPLPRRLPVREVDSMIQAKAVVGPLRASDAEQSRNPRSRSALLRAVERCA